MPSSYLAKDQSRSEAGQVAAISVTLAVILGAIGFYAYRRRMAVIERRQKGLHKHKEMKTDIVMAHLVNGILKSLFFIALETADLALDWYSHLRMTIVFYR